MYNNLYNLGAELSLSQPQLVDPNYRLYLCLAPIMGTPISLQPTLSVGVVKSYSTTTAHPFKCDWNGCTALLNCWINLQKHYHWHCKQSHNVLVTPSCGLRVCTLDRSRSLTRSGLMEHINKVHLSRVYIPCPVAGCPVVDPLDRIYIHFQNDHDSHSNMVLAPQAFPFVPAPDPKPMPPLPPGLVPIYTLSPLIIVPGCRTKPLKVPNPTSAHRPTNKSEHHLTFWSYFEYTECISAQEERSMRRHDIDFEPLHRPSLSDKDLWPEFTVSAEPVVVSQRNLMSAPPMPTRISPPLPPPSRVNEAAPQTFLYHAFKRFLDEKSS